MRCAAPGALRTFFSKLFSVIVVPFSSFVGREPRYRLLGRSALGARRTVGRRSRYWSCTTVSSPDSCRLPIPGSLLASCRRRRELGSPFCPSNPDEAPSYWRADSLRPCRRVVDREPVRGLEARLSQRTAPPSRPVRASPPKPHRPHGTPQTTQPSDNSTIIAVMVNREGPIAREPDQRTGPSTCCGGFRR